MSRILYFILYLCNVLFSRIILFKWNVTRKHGSVGIVLRVKWGTIIT